jgi:hypothetical protein
MANHDSDILITFLRLLHDLNSDLFGRFGPVEQKRIQRRMDAVLPPPPPKETDEVPFLEEEAAE